MNSSPNLRQLWTSAQESRTAFQRDQAAGHPWSRAIVTATRDAILDCLAEDLAIYTAGYAAWRSWRDFETALHRLDPILLDIRLSPHSANPDYQQQSLMARLGQSYIHLPEWGNLNYKVGGTFKIRDFERGLDRLIKEIMPVRPILLMCGCRDYGSCHRSEVSNLLRLRGFSASEYSLVAEQPTPQVYQPRLMTPGERRLHNRAYLTAIESRRSAA